MAVLLTADKDNPLDGTTIGTTLDDLQQAVRGYIELVYLPDSKVMVVDEEGLLKFYPINREASLLAQRPIVGDVVIANQDEIK
tara:strand:+ start:74 stop:322 length:249 start_codon:yes stop_codon:yes gene_type:complete